MKYGFAIAALFALAAPALAGWEASGPYTQVDPASFKPDATGFTLALRHYDLAKAGLPPPLESTVSHDHFDCRAHQSVQIDIAYYDAHDHLIGCGPTPNDRPMNDLPASVPGKIEARFCPKVGLR